MKYLDVGFWFNNMFAGIYEVVPPAKILHIPLRMIEGLLEVLEILSMSLGLGQAFCS